MTSVAPAPAAGSVDPEGILCALALAPSTYSRNKHPSLYADPAVRRAQRRARLLRGLVRQVLRFGITSTEVDGEGVVLRIVAPDLAYRREARLTSLEHDLVRYLAARAEGSRAPEACARIEAVLARLAL